MLHLQKPQHLKPGDKVIVSHTVDNLKDRIKANLIYPGISVDVLTKIFPETEVDRFEVINSKTYSLAYLVERKEEEAE